MLERAVAMPAPTVPSPRKEGRINSGSSSRFSRPPKETPMEA